MEPRKYHKIRLSRAGNEIWEFVKKQKIYEIPIISVATIVNCIVANKYYDILVALLYEFVALFIMCVFLFLWKSMRVVPERIYNEQQDVIDSQLETIESLKEQLRPKLEVTFKQGIRPWFQGESGHIHTHRIGIINPGVETVQKVTVQLIDIEPYPKGCNFTMPCCLQFMNELQSVESINLQTSKDPKEGRFINVFDSDYDSNGRVIVMRICHTVCAGTETYSIPVQSYEIKIAVSSDNGGESIIKCLRFDPKKEDVKDMMEMID